MPNSGLRITQQGRVRASVTPEEIATAQGMREASDKNYGNVYPEEDTDRRWSGDLGEMHFDKAASPFVWWNKTSKGAGQADFIWLATEEGIDVKMRAFKCAWLEHFDNIVTEEIVLKGEWLFFVAFEEPLARITFIGGIRTKDFLTCRKFIQKGVMRGTWKPKHNCWTVLTSDLIPAVQFLEMLGVKRT